MGNLGMSTTRGVMRNHQGVVLAAFGSFLGHYLILFVELMAMLEELDLATQLGFNVLEVESDSTIVVSWANSHCQVWWGYVYLLGRIHTLSSDPSIVIRNVFQEGTFATDFMANWACTHQTHQRFFSIGEPPSSLFGILDLDDRKFSHVRH